MENNEENTHQIAAVKKCTKPNQVPLNAAVIDWVE